LLNQEVKAEFPGGPSCRIEWEPGMEGK